MREMREYENLPVIEKAVFSDTEGNALSYKELPKDKVINVSGRLIDGTKIDINGHVDDNVFISGDDKYTFIPLNASLVENAIEMLLDKLKVSDNDGEATLLVSDVKSEMEEVKKMIKEGKTVRAIGRIVSHYRTKERYIETSAVRDITILDRKIYIHTKNSVYLVWVA